MEAERYKKNCLGFAIIGIDYNDYLPWIVQNQIKMIYDKVNERYDYVGGIDNGFQIRQCCALGQKSGRI